VRFAPGSTGAKAATLRIATDAAGSPQTVALTGTGVAAPVTVTGRARSAGGVTLVWNGKIKRKAAPAGKYTLRIRAATADGQVATTTVATTLKKR
jgi:hypothetical protein